MCVRVCCRLLQFIADHYVPVHPDLRRLRPEHFDTEFLASFRAGRPSLTEIHPYIFTVRCVSA